MGQNNHDPKTGANVCGPLPLWTKVLKWFNSEHPQSFREAVTYINLALIL